MAWHSRAEEQEDAAENDNEDEVEFEEQETTEPERHLTGQELSEAIRQYAIDQYGFLAKQVLNSWGLHTTGDFGEVVYNLIRVGLMKKSSEDRREDFDDCFDFEQAFVKKFRFVKPAKI